MKVYELTIPVLMKKSVSHKNSYESISSVINKAMLLEKNLKILHEKNVFKNYVFSNLYPVNKNKDYEKGEIYKFRLRTISKDFALKIKELIKKIDTDLFQIIAVEFRFIKYNYIEGLYTVTPTICTFTENNNIKHWNQFDFSMKELENRINNNAIRKYEKYTNEIMPRNLNIIKGIELLTKKPIVIPYKKGILLGNKLKIYFKDDTISQKLAYMMLGTGVLEKNSIGMGYCTHVK